VFASGGIIGYQKVSSAGDRIGKNRNSVKNAKETLKFWMLYQGLTAMTLIAGKETPTAPPSVAGRF